VPELGELLKESTKGRGRIPLRVVRQFRRVFSSDDGMEVLAYLHAELGWGADRIETTRDLANYELLMHLRNLCGLNASTMQVGVLRAEMRLSKRLMALKAGLRGAFRLGVPADAFEPDAKPLDPFDDTTDLSKPSSVPAGGIDLLGPEGA